MSSTLTPSNTAETWGALPLPSTNLTTKIFEKIIYINILNKRIIMKRSLSHMFFGKPFASASVISAHGYWRPQPQEDCCEYNYLDNCEI